MIICMDMITELNPNWHITLLFIGLILILLTIPIQTSNSNENNKPHLKSLSSSLRNQSLTKNEQITNNIILLIILINLINTILQIIECIDCIQCKLIVPFRATTYIFARNINYIFFVHRATMSQSPTSIFSKKHSQKILIIIIMFISILMCIGTAYSTSTTNIQCIQYKDKYLTKWILSRCQTMIGNQIEIGVISIICADILITIFLLYLHCKPLIEIYKLDFGQLNQTQIRAKKKVKTLLICTIILTFINLVSSNIALFGSRILRLNIFICFYGFDPSINVLTTVLIKRKNRNYLKSHCFCNQQSTQNVSFSVINYRQNIECYAVNTPKTNKLCTHSRHSI